MTMVMNDVVYLSIADASVDIEAGRLSPVDLTEATLRRIEETDDQLNSYVLVMKESALAEAEASAERARTKTRLGPLDGIPMGIKDLYDTAGAVTTNGTAAHRFRVPTADSTPVARLRAAGAVIIGKTNTHELAMGGTTNNVHYGPTRNPWNLDRIPGGSSGGSGSALATGQAMGALGSDTGGSIRGPSSYCGISGIKPTYGLSSRAGVGALSHTLDHTGPMARTAYDCALMLNALQGYDPLDLDSADHPTEDFTDGIEGGVSGMTFAVIPSLLAIAAPDVKAAFAAALATFESLGARITTVEPLAGIDDYRGMVQNISAVESNDYNEAIIAQEPPVIGASIRARLAIGRAIPSYLYARALDSRKMIERRMQDGLKDNGIDAYLLPTTPLTAFPIDPDANRDETPVLARNSFMPVFNMSRQPSMSVPNGFDSEGLPTGLMISGAQWTDAKVLRIAHAFQQATDYHLQRPPLFA
jgi:aspartyl-tRNA(Asn)/glutamyl-tRNA(Gln) amidotransferase subunit A